MILINVKNSVLHIYLRILWRIESSWQHLS